MIWKRIGAEHPAQILGADAFCYLLENEKYEYKLICNQLSMTMVKRFIEP